MVKTVAIILAAVLLAAAPALADPPPPTSLMRVDQAVGDLDKLSLSMRKIEPGLRVPTQLPALFVPVPKPTDSVSYTSPLAGPVPYYRMGPGYRARMDRLNYLIIINLKTRDSAMNITPIKDGTYFEIVPANMVYELNPLFPSVTTIDRAAPMNGGIQNHQPSAQIDRRVPSTRVETQVNRRIEPTQVDLRVDAPR